MTSSQPPVSIAARLSRKREAEFLEELAEFLEDTGMDLYCGIPTPIVAARLMGELHALRKVRCDVARHEGRRVQETAE